MKRPYYLLKSVVSPPESPYHDTDSPNKTPNYGTNSVPPFVVPYSEAQAVSSPIALMLNELCSDYNHAIDDIVVDNPGKLLVFLDAQGKQYVQEFEQTVLRQFLVPVIFVSSGWAEVLPQHTSDEQCRELSKYFSVLDPLGGGSYPLNRLVFVCDNMVRMNVALRLNYFNRFEKFGVRLEDLGGVLQETIPYLV